MRSIISPKQSGRCTQHRRSIASAVLGLLLAAACTNDESASSTPTSVTVPAAGAQASPAAGSGGEAGAAAGQAGQTSVAPPDASVTTVPPRLGPPAPSDASTPIDAGGGEVDDDAGVADPHAPTCAGDVWQLAQGFRVTRQVDYVADREVIVNGLLSAYMVTRSSAGVPCATATNRENCMSALEQVAQVGRHLVTTEGDNVRVWTGAVARTLLGLVDTPAEAVWFALASPVYVVPCTAKVEATEDGFVIRGATPGPGCFMAIDKPLDLLVTSSDAFVREQSTTSALVCQPVTMMPNIAPPPPISPPTP